MEVNDVFYLPTIWYKMAYTALRSWDFVPYLPHAELRLFEDKKKIAYGEFHLNGKGGLALTKLTVLNPK